VNEATAQPNPPRIGDRAPEFKAASTTSPEFNFSEWQGQDWVVLFSHPADFTPVCTTELIEFARLYERFRARNTKLIAVSVDSVHSHLAWLQSIKQRMGVTVPYPIVADVDFKISTLYGMIHPGASSTATVRALFVIDPRRIVRAVIHYPMSAGRNVDEILRLVTALQTADKHHCATPANWQEGDKVVLWPPRTVAEVEERLSASEQETKDFYLSLKELPKA
jgi:peroxiredoxin (alkyl hydroperoxide reductase subunit C)